jgi:hypothetical protein
MELKLKANHTDTEVKRILTIGSDLGNRRFELSSARYTIYTWR